MNRDFEIRQLLRAYRSGLISEAMFEEEMTRLEHETGHPEEGQPVGPPPFEIFGRIYRSEREAVLSFLDELHASQLDSAVAFARWAAVCNTRDLRTGLLIAAERAAMHARVIQRRVTELGGELRRMSSPDGSKLVEALGSSGVSDVEKLAALAALIEDPTRTVAPLTAFVEALKRDTETKQALRLIAEDDLSTITWLHDMSGSLLAEQPLAAS
jgi:hypothetical protein